MPLKFRQLTPAEVAEAFDDLPDEEWRPVLGYEGIYEVSSQGRVRRIAPYSSWKGARTRLSGTGRQLGEPSMRVLRGNATTQGYPCIALAWEGVNKTRMIHHLVCEAFHGPRPTKKHTVNHINGDKADNRADNLEWMTMAEQRAHARTLHPDQPGWYRALTAEQAAEVVSHPEISTREWAQRFGVNGVVIQRIRRGTSYRWAGPGRTAPANGLHWHPCAEMTCACACHYA